MGGGGCGGAYGLFYAARGVCIGGADYNQRTGVAAERLAASLVRMGYVRAETAEAQGQFAQRGGITDIFPVGSDSPLRVEFFDTEIESLRVIDPATQRSVSRLESAQLLPARLFCPTQRQAAAAGEAMKASVRAAVRRLAGTPEAAARAEGFSEAAQSIARGDVSAFEDRFSCFLQRKAGLLEYFGKDTLLVLDEPRRLRERCDNIHLEFSEGFKDLLTAGRALAAQGGTRRARGRRYLPIYWPGRCCPFRA